MRHVVTLLAAMAGMAMAGPFAPAPEEVGSTAVSFEDPRILAWATGVASIERGPVDIAVPNGARASHGAAADALGAATEEVFDVVSLGDGGQITLTFAAPIADRPGADFAVFENGFEDGYIELAFVEVSSDGVNFFRFAAQSLTPVTKQVGNLDYLEPTDIHNLAGKYRAGYGVPFDLSELAGTPGLNVFAVTQVRIVDAIGTVNGALASRDSSGRMVNDPYPTNFTTGGFDLDGVAVLQPEPQSFMDWVDAHFNAMDRAFSAPDLDPDHDGWSNLEECAFGGDPHRAEGRSPLSVLSDGGLLEIGFERIPWQTDLTYSVQFSADMRTWTEVARGTGGGAVMAMLAGITIDGASRVNVASSSPVWKFGRVKLLLNP
jgi:hypothetical protein